MTDISDAVVADWVTLDDLVVDPYPVFERLRREAPVAWIPFLNRFFVSRFADCFFVETHNELFVPQTNSLVRESIGVSMISKGDPEHARERSAIAAAVKARTVNEVWQPVFQANADRFVAGLKEVGPGVDLDSQFAVPFSAANLGALLGLINSDWTDINRWSKQFIAGSGNLAGDPEVWLSNGLANDEVNDAIDELVPYYLAHPDSSMLSSLLSAPVKLPIEVIRANMKLAISGGFNEPEHVITSGLWSLDTHPETHARVRADESLFAALFNEVIRWRSPINLLNREAAVDVEIDGVHVAAGTLVGLLIGSANRDERQYDHPEDFDIFRKRRPHLGFGVGIHLCAGSWAAKVEVADVAWPTLYRELPGLHIVEPETIPFSGFAFRGLPTVPIAWNA